jgi:poly(A) polymerase
MQAVGQLSPQEWLSHADTRRVIAALTAEGATARFAGGCVRDALLNLPVADIDIAIDRPPEETLRLLKAAGIRAIPTGIDHGTITAVTPSRHYEITTLRRDVETDGRHAVVAFTDDWAADAMRRDLTINALFADIEGRVFDPVDGMADLGARRVRFVGHAETRIAEDVLRILRFFRFHGRYGAPPADADALAACRRLAPKIADLSGERVRDEMLKILGGHHPAEVIVLMRGEGVTRWVLPESLDIGRLRLLSWLEERGIPGFAADPLRRLGALIAHASDDAAAEVAARWRLSNAEADRLLAMRQPSPEGVPHVAMPVAAARRALDDLGTIAWQDQVLLAWSEYRDLNGTGGPVPGSRGTCAWEVLLHLPETDPLPTFPLTGADVVAQGVAPGPRVGQLLRQLRAEWRAEDFRPDRADLLARLARVVDARET